ncbi:hypothetical protein AMECASPLE_035159 [Ameca splendens]|uniref:Integrase core domain-containing protein n=1 Tax=Ameca splendens TaxID=208324 RepID=A0ABV0Z690_9TELE
MYETSTSNQRIKSLWSYFRKQRSQFWMDLFNDLRESHLFNGSRQHMILVRYCFLGVLQKELDKCKQLWNTHTIRPVRQSKCLSGKPEAMHHLPHRFNGRNCGFPASAQALSQFNTLMPTAGTPSDDDGEQENWKFCAVKKFKTWLRVQTSRRHAWHTRGKHEDILQGDLTVMF